MRGDKDWGTPGKSDILELGPFDYYLKAFISTMQCGTFRGLITTNNVIRTQVWNMSVDQKYDEQRL